MKDGLDRVRRRIAAECRRFAGSWPEDEWLAVGDGILLNVYTDADGRRRATAFEESDENLEFGVDIEYAGDGGMA